MNTRELLETMVAFRPVSGEVENVNRLVEFMEEYLRRYGVHTELHNLGARRILYAATQATRTPDFLFNAHLDVVPAPDTMFELHETNDGWLVGRGTHDCLGNSAILAQMLHRNLGLASAGVIFSTDEEIGGETTREMAAGGYCPKKMVLVVDGSGYSLVIAQKGVLVLRLSATGRGCHAAEPWKGVNAIDALLQGYGKLRELFPEVTADDQWHNTMAATTVHAGNVHNRIPDEAEMTLNIRFTQDSDAASLTDRIRAQCKLGVDVEMLSEPVFCDPEHPELVALRQFMREQLGREIDIKYSNGATDARHFTECGVPIAIIGAPGRDLHGNDEAIDLAGLAAYEELLVNFVRARS